MSRDFKGVWIPTELIGRYGINNAVVIAGLLQDAPMERFSRGQIREAKKLMSKEMKLTPNEIKARVLNNTGKYICQWCDSTCHSLHRHHFPVPKSRGGTEVVSICGMCHADYHEIETYGKIKEDILEMFAEVVNG